MKIGLLGGTFDPIHNGHLLLAESAYEQFKLDKVLIMPTGNPPHKINSVQAKLSDRCEMIKKAIEGNSHLEFSDIDCTRTGYIYTADTLEILKQRHPDNDYYFIMGADSLFAIETWHEPARIFYNAVILAAMRDKADNDDVLCQIEYLHDKYNCDIRLLLIQKVDISSHSLREQITSGNDVSNYVPKAVSDYILENKLYEWQ